MKQIFGLLLFGCMLALSCCHGDGCNDNDPTPTPDPIPTPDPRVEKLKELMTSVAMTETESSLNMRDTSGEGPNVDTLNTSNVVFPTGSIKDDANNKARIIYMQPDGVDVTGVSSFTITDNADNPVATIVDQYHWDGKDDQGVDVPTDAIYKYEFTLDFTLDGNTGTYTQSGDFLHAECYDATIDNLDFESEINNTAIPVVASHQMSSTANCP